MSLRTAGTRHPVLARQRWVTVFVVLLAGLLHGPAPAFAQESAPHRIQMVDEIGGSPMLQTWEGDRVYVSRHSRIDVLDARGAGRVMGTAGPFGWGIYSLAVKHQILAVVSDDVHVFDFSRPDRPRWIASAPLQGEPGSARWVEDELWVTHLGRVRRYDLSDPYQPRVLPDWLPGNPNHNPPFIVAAMARGEGRHVVLIEYLNNHRSGLVQELLTVALQGDETPRVVGRMKVPCCESNRLLSIDGALILAYAWKGLSLRKVVMDAEGLPAGLQELALLDPPASSVYIAHTKGVIWLVDRGRTLHMLDESSFEALQPPRSPESMFGCPSRTQGIQHLALRDRLLVVACDRAFWLDADGRVTPGPAWSVTRIGGVFSGPGHVVATALLPGQSDWRFTRVESGGGSIGLRPMSGPFVGRASAATRMEIDDADALLPAERGVDRLPLSKGSAMAVQHRGLPERWEVSHVSLLDAADDRVAARVSLNVVRPPPFSSFRLAVWSKGDAHPQWLPELQAGVHPMDGQAALDGNDLWVLTETDIEVDVRVFHLADDPRPKEAAPALRTPSRAGSIVRVGPGLVAVGMAGEVQILQREGDRIHVLHRIDLRTSGYRMAVSWPVFWILDGKTLRAFDVSDPSASNLLATHSLGADSSTLAVSGRCLWVATNTLQRFMLHGPVADRIAAPLPTVAPHRPMPDPSAWPAGRRLSLPWVGQARALSVTEQCR